ncbi:protein O-linked-mannose beta-1,4-N-acetylglucosaminyltransferase 2-like isoform X2 [Lycorma delicatula]
MFVKFQVMTDNEKYFKNGDNYIVLVDEPILLIRRFKSDNIMHVIHDDILPIYMTYNHLCAGDVELCVKNNRLMFSDDLSDNEMYLEWYKLFSSKKPYTLKNLKAMTCFNKVFVGLSRESVWFQYGFGKPQGSISSATLNSAITNKFKDFILSGFNIRKPVLSLNNLNIILLSRKNNRKILNEDFVISKISSIFKSVYPEYNEKLKIHVLDPSQNNSYSILTTVIESQILVGMHGSAMIYTLFLPEKSAIVEMFPFGIQPQHVSPTRALCQLPGIFHNYLSWRNFKEINTITYPDRSPLHGGIAHLSKNEQENIKNLKIIPAVECCHDPAYLYRMFQDTIVDDSFEVILKQVLINQKEMYQNVPSMYFTSYINNYWFFPAPVSNVTCKIDRIVRKIFVKWNKPHNIQSMELTKLSVLYSVTIKIFSRVVMLETLSYIASIKLTSEEISSAIQNCDIHVWIKVSINENESIDTHSFCTFLN